MNIGIEASPASFPNKAGIGFYITNLLTEMAKLDTFNSFNVYSLKEDVALKMICSNNYKFTKLPDLLPNIWLSWAAWTYSGFLAQVMPDNLDSYLAMYPILPFIKPARKNTIVIYDLTPLQLKGAYADRFALVFKAQLYHAAKRADKIIAISHYVANDIMKLFNIPASKIEVVYPGYDKSAFNASISLSAIETAKKRYCIDKQYIINVGTLEPKKNILRLICAYDMLRDENKIDHKLVIVGKGTWKDNDVTKAVCKSEYRDDIILTGYVDDALPTLIKGADAFVFPSINEGFGIPPIEAMACGVPVITSDITAMPEVAGGAAMLVDPYSINNIAEAIYRVINCLTLRSEMKEAGHNNCKRFDTQQSAQKLLDIIKS